MSFAQLIVLISLAFGVIFLIIIVIKSIAVPKHIEGIKKLISQGKNVQAIKLAKSMLSKNPDDYLAHYYLGKAYLADNRSELALMEYKTVNQTGIFGIDLPELDFRRLHSSERISHVEEKFQPYTQNTIRMKRL